MKKEIKKIKWKTEKRKVSDLIPASYNPRKISDKERSDLLDSIKEFNEVLPVVINTNNNLIGGHQRCEIYADLGIEDVEVRIPNRELNKKEEEKLNLRLNKNTGSFDSEKLGYFDIGTLLEVGFDEEVLSDLWDEVDIMSDEHNPKEDIEKAKTTKIKEGDIYELGEHILMCGDSTKEEDVKKLMGYKCPCCFIKNI